MKRILLSAFIFSLLITGCAGKPAPCPKDETVAPVELKEPDVYRPGYTVLAYDRPGLVGRIASAPGHVLTTEPAQDYAELEKTLDAQKREKLLKIQKETADKLKSDAEEKRKYEDRITIPKISSTQAPVKEAVKPVVATEEELWQQAWKRYCDNGQGLTNADIEILKNDNYTIPVQFMGRCLPPK